MLMKDIIQLTKYFTLTMGNDIKISCSPSLFNLLTIAFIILKIKGTIDWSWWWVLAPTWIPIVTAITFLILFIIIKIVLMK